jgi:hypothetical protein
MRLLSLVIAVAWSLPAVGWAQELAVAPADATPVATAAEPTPVAAPDDTTAAAILPSVVPPAAPEPAPPVAPALVLYPEDPATRDARTFPIGFHAWTVFRTTQPDATRVDTDPGLPQVPVDRPRTGRLRVGGMWVDAGKGGPVKRSSATLEFDLWRNQHSIGLRWDDPDAALRRGFVEAITDYGLFGAGRTLSTWGVGLLAHDGEDDPMQPGARMGGNIVDRVQYAFAPGSLFGRDEKSLPLFLAVALDRVVRDDVVDAAAGDVARNAVAALFYRSKDWELGGYFVDRSHDDAQGLGLQARIGDIAGKVNFALGPGTLELAGEGVIVRGETTWLRTPLQPPGIDVAQQGGVLRADWTQALNGHGKGLRARLELGHASGDDRPFDATLRPFRFAADHQTTLLLFREAVRQNAAVTALRLSDPALVGAAPAGVEHLDTKGAITNATYIAPAVRMQPYDWLGLLVAATWARAPVDVADPFQSSLAGGQATAWRGAVQARDLGMELDAALELRPRLPYGFWLVVRYDYGVFWPGAAFAGNDGKPARSVTGTLYQLRLEKRF